MRLTLLAACACILLIRGSARAQDWGDVPELSESQLDVRLRQSERMLAQGRYLQALRHGGSADEALFSDRAMSFAGWPQLSDRSRALGWTCVVRLKGAYDILGKRTVEPRLELVKAEERLRDLLPRKNPLYTARHAEALVALGDRMPEAYAALHSIHEAGALTEPEGYAALQLAARATEHADIARTAQQRCRKLAKGRAHQACPQRE
jgi:hypothetical protein